MSFPSLRITIPSSNTHPMMTRSKTKALPRQEHTFPFTPVLSPMDAPVPVPAPVPIRGPNALYAVASGIPDHSKCGKNCSLHRTYMRPVAAPAPVAEEPWPTPAMTSSLSTVVPPVTTVAKKEFTKENPPTREEFCAMGENEAMWWECIVCGGPALAGSWQVGRLCSSNCAYQKYAY